MIIKKRRKKEENSIFYHSPINPSTYSIYCALIKQSFNNIEFYQPQYRFQTKPPLPKTRYLNVTGNFILLLDSRVNYCTASIMKFIIYYRAMNFSKGLYTSHVRRNSIRWRTM